MSWLAIGYVFYKISIIRILFGKKREDYIYKNSFIKNKNFDLILIISYYLFMLSDFIFFIASTKEIILF